MAHGSQAYSLQAPQSSTEDPRYLTEQLITYIGNKRALLPLIDRGLTFALDRLGSEWPKATNWVGASRVGGGVILDLFSGSGVVSRFFKRYARQLITNDLEHYAEVLSRCYLADVGPLRLAELRTAYAHITAQLGDDRLGPGIIAAHYAPKSELHILPGERAFYTPRNAAYLDTARRAVAELAPEDRPFFLAPLLSEASIHANTAGVFKGFYKDRVTGVGKFGGTGGDALSRILRPIRLPFPVFSRFYSDVEVHREDANQLIRKLPPVDIAYLDPPYNQHPYGSNYFMLNLLVDYEEPAEVSPVSGIPARWNRSAYNKRRLASKAMADLIANIDARVIMVSINSESLFDAGRLREWLNARGETHVFETGYATFRGCRNLRRRSLSVTEYLYVTVTC